MEEYTMKEVFLAEFDRTVSPQMIVVAIQLPIGNIELIVNYSMLKEKMDYYINAYDDTLCLKANPEVKIVRWMVV